MEYCLESLSLEKLPIYMRPAEQRLRTYQDMARTKRSYEVFMMAIQRCPQEKELQEARMTHLPCVRGLSLDYWKGGFLRDVLG